MPGPDIVRRNFRQYDRDNGQAGILATPGPAWALATRAVSANQATLVRFVPSRNMTIVNIAIIVAVAASIDDPSDVAIYDGTTLARLVSAGATAGKLNATGTKTYAVTPTTLRAGKVYYAAQSTGTVGGTAATIVALSCGNVFAASGGFGAANPQAEAGNKSTSHPLPDPIAPSWGGLSAMGAVWLLES